MVDKHKYTFEEAYNASLDYFKGDELAAKVWVNKYALKDSYGNIYEKTPDDMHFRLASEIARIESKYIESLSKEEIYNVISGFKYIVPSGSPMTGIGNPFQVSSLSNCFVIGGKNDSYGGICKLDEEQIQLMKRRGGVGHDLSHIRPKGSPVKNSALTSTGIVPFMERYSNTTREVAQDGRRGALMLSVSITHPDAEDFINAKVEQGKVTGANVSVKITDDFMKSVKNDGLFVQKFPIDAELRNVETTRLTVDELVFNKDIYTKVVRSKPLWDKIIHNAWKSAEPGVLFWDTIMRESLPDCYSKFGFETVSTNPCGEIPLSPYDSCRLLAINLYSYVENPFTSEAYFNIALFEKHARIAQRIMDDIIDLEIEKIETIIEKIKSDPESDDIKSTELSLWEKVLSTTINGRRTGVGITAEGDMLAAMNLTYGTDEATDFAEFVHLTLAKAVYTESINLAMERGAFKVWNESLEEKNPFLNRILENLDGNTISTYHLYGRRNIACLTIAPTGTTSIMTQSTSGIEPVFLPVYKRRRKVNPNDVDVTIDFVDENGDSWEEYIVFHHKFIDWMKANGIDTDRKYTADEVDELVMKSPYYKASSNDVDWLQKVRMQGRIQKWVDHSISVTINLPKDVEESLVNDIYMEAWRCGCKGCTVYRDGSRAGVLVSTTENNKKDKQETETKKRPKVLSAYIHHFQNNKERWVAIIGKRDNGTPYEIFTGKADEEEGLVIPKSITEGTITKSKKDGENTYTLEYKNNKGYKTTIECLEQKFNPEYWNYNKMISGMLRYEVPLDGIIRIWTTLDMDCSTINTYKNGFERALKKFMSVDKVSGQKCPNCGLEAIAMIEGCLKCTSCGFSKCG